MSRKFTYKRRSADDVRKRQQTSGGDFDSLFIGSVKTFTPPEGQSNVRILPPTGEDMDHYGIPAYVHYSIGPDNNRYWCSQKMGQGPCAICKARNAASSQGDEETAKALKPSSRVIVYVIDRANEDDGPLVWDMAYTIDSEISGLMLDDEMEGGVVPIDDPEEGYDIQFKRVGKDLKTQYSNYKIARKPSPLAKDPRDQDDWIAHIMKYPLDSILNFYPYEHIDNVFSGEVQKEEDEDDAPKRGREDTRGKEEEKEEETGGEDENKDEDEPRGRPRVNRGGDDDDKPKRTGSTTQFRRLSGNRR